MPIHPITSERLKTFLLIGHSNADGFGNLFNLYSNYPSYAPRTDPSVLIGDPANSYWPNVYVLTSAQPFPLSTGEGNVNVPSTVDDVEWLEMTAANPETPAGPHPHASPFNYANIKGSCWPRYLWHLWENYAPGWASGSSGVFGNGDWPTPADSPSGDWFAAKTFWPSISHGVEVPLQFYFKSYWQEQIGMVKMAFPGSVVMPDDNGVAPHLYLDPWVAGSKFTPADTYYVASAVDMTGGSKEPGTQTNDASYAYWTPMDKWDWSPATDRFYKMLIDKLTAGATALPDGSKMDIRLIIPWFGDNDSWILEQVVLQNSWEKTVRAIIKRLRADIEANDWSAIPAHQIAIVWPHIFTTYAGPNDSPNFSSVDYMNGVLDTIAADDPYMETIATSDLETMEDVGEKWFDNLVPLHAPYHFGSTGYHNAALRIMDAFESMQVDPFDALDLDETLTVTQMKARVRTYYGKSRANTDCSDETTLLQHINAAMFHCLNHAGDNLWWLRRRLSLSLEAGSNTIVTMPRYVQRVIKIESQGDIDYTLQFEQVGHADGGKLQILIHGAGQGSYYVHFITLPKDLTTDGQRIPVPKNIAEWIAVETCHRLAASSNHTSLQAHFAAESQRLLVAAMRNMAQVQRTKRDRLYTQRRMVRLGYKSRTRY